MSSPIIQICDLSIKRENQILYPLNWTVFRDEKWIIMGPNGCGKTTLLHALTGYFSPSKGTIELLGKRYGQTDWRELRKNIGIISASLSQNFSQHDTVLELVVSGQYAFLSYKLPISPKDKTKAEKILKNFGCLSLKNQLFYKLSQGEKQKIMIARALMADYQVMILDEPCAGLDPVARESFLRFLEKIISSEKSKTFIMVTHHVEEILPLFSHVMIMKKGTILKSGKKEETLTHEFLSEAFDANIHLSSINNRYRMEIKKN